MERDKVREAAAAVRSAQDMHKVNEANARQARMYYDVAMQRSEASYKALRVAWTKLEEAISE